MSVTFDKILALKDRLDEYGIDYKDVTIKVDDMWKRELNGPTLNISVADGKTTVSVLFSMPGIHDNRNLSNLAACLPKNDQPYINNV